MRQRPGREGLERRFAAGVPMTHHAQMGNCTNVLERADALRRTCANLFYISVLALLLSLTDFPRLQM
jgi:hypothetical protein